jgi:hypothetical protein
MRSRCHGKRRICRPARPKGGLVLTREERRRFNEIARRIDQETAVTGTAPVPETAAPIPVRLTMFGLIVIGVTAVLTGLATDDLIVIVLAVVGVVTTFIAAVLFAFTGTPGPAPAAATRPADGRLEPRMSLLTRLWHRLTTCEENGCGNRPLHLGWCSEHAPAYDPKPDEYWGDYWDDSKSDSR